MPSQQVPPRPDPREPVDHQDRSLSVLVWVTVGVNALLALLTLVGRLGRATSCEGGCPWRPSGGMLWVLLAILDVGLVLIWSGMGYLYLVRFGERIGRRISERGDGDQD
jgi:hypothetical protein